MINFMKDIYKMVNKMEKEFFIIIMEINTQEIGKIIYFMDQEFIYFQKEKDLRDN